MRRDNEEKNRLFVVVVVVVQVKLLHTRRLRNFYVNFIIANEIKKKKTPAKKLFSYNEQAHTLKM